MNLKLLIQQAIQEDLGKEDITSNLLLKREQKGTGKIIAKQNLVLAGLDVAKKVFLRWDPTLKFKPLKKDGQHVLKGQTVAKIEGSAASILKAERVALNFLQHLSGVATLTRKFVEKTKGTKAEILDTRKTIPGLRELEKYAVRQGGGKNHRLGLFDRYLIKSNHIVAVGSLSQVIEGVLHKKKRGILVEVEVKTLKELKIALQYPLDIILLDNFSPAQVKKAISWKKGRVQFEVSGGITLQNVREYAQTGIDFISIGALTHSAPAADLHLVI